MYFNAAQQNKRDENHSVNQALFALLMCCPFNGGPHESCPLKEYRLHDLAPEEKFSFIEGLHETSRLHILALHNRCVEMRADNGRSSNPEYYENIERVPKSLYDKYCLVKRALEETIREKRCATFN